MQWKEGQISRWTSFRILFSHIRLSFSVFHSFIVFREHPRVIISSKIMVVINAHTVSMDWRIKVTVHRDCERTRDNHHKLRGLYYTSLWIGFIFSFVLLYKPIRDQSFKQISISNISSTPTQWPFYLMAGWCGGEMRYEFIPKNPSKKTDTNNGTKSRMSSPLR